MFLGPHGRVAEVANYLLRRPARILFPSTRSPVKAGATPLQNRAQRCRMLP